MASTATQTIYSLRNTIKLVVDIVADSSDGSVDDIVLATGEEWRIRGKFLYRVETDPGTTAPTDNYDITIVNERGIDILGTKGTNRSESTSQAIVPSFDGTSLQYPVMEHTNTLKIANNSVHSATIQVVLFLG